MGDGTESTMARERQRTTAKLTKKNDVIYCKQEKEKNEQKCDEVRTLAKVRK